jgi:hypothetical protein
LIESRVAETILGTDGVVELTSLNMAFSGQDRRLLIEFSYIDIYGNQYSSSQEVA